MFIDTMIYIGIDTGTHTGFAVWDSGLKTFLEVKTLMLHQALEKVRLYNDMNKVSVYVEDARKRKWFGDTGREKLKGAGSVCRDAKIWEEFCLDHKIEFVMVAPKNNRTKLSAKQFVWLTGWKERTSEHARDAGMLVFGK